MHQARSLKTSEIRHVRAAILKQQNGICPICETPIEKPALDHDHSLGHVRGVLCSWCNSIEGRVRGYGVRARRHLTYLQWLQNLLAYLTDHSTNRTGLIHPKHKTPEQKKALKCKKLKKSKPTP